MSEGIVQVDLTWESIDSGIILNYQDPENFGVMLLIDAGASAVPAYVEYVIGQKGAIRAYGGSAVTLTDNTRYRLKTVVTESGGNYTLDFYIDLNGDNDFNDSGEHPLSNCAWVDVTWTGGFVVESYMHLEQQCKTVKDRRTLQEKSILGGEAKPLPDLHAGVTRNRRCTAMEEVERYLGCRNRTALRGTKRLSRTYEW